METTWNFRQDQNNRNIWKKLMIKQKTKIDETATILRLFALDLIRMIIKSVITSQRVKY
jgi:hypothetical protein